MKLNQSVSTARIRPHVSHVAPLNRASLAGLDACIEDARQAALVSDPGPAEPDDYRPLLDRLEAVRGKFPPLYRDAMVTPFWEKLRSLGEAGFQRVLSGDPQRTGAAALMMDIAQAILQQGEGFLEVPTDAFQEVVSDLYDGFLSAEDRQGINPPDLGVIPPLVKWGNPDSGPYTWPVDATGSFGCKAGVVNLPPANARQGLVAWSALGHETAGHDILHADTGLPEELATALQQDLLALGHGLDQYWSSRIDETASDVMGILNLGPAAGIGLIAYFRALNAAFTGQARLRSEGPGGDPHPADILRGYLAAETVALLEFTGHDEWSRLIAAETNKDLATIVLAEETVPANVARQSARIVAQTLARHRSKALENHALAEIQNWRDSDEQKVQLLRTALRTNGALPATPESRVYAAHVVAAAVTEVLADSRDLPAIFERMLEMLKIMHNQNPSWGPLLVTHPGNLARDFYYRRQPTAAGRTHLPSGQFAFRNIRGRSGASVKLRTRRANHRTRSRSG